MRNPAKKLNTTDTLEMVYYYFNPVACLVQSMIMDQLINPKHIVCISERKNMFCLTENLT